MILLRPSTHATTLTNVNERNKRSARGTKTYARPATAPGTGRPLGSLALLVPTGHKIYGEKVVPGTHNSPSIKEGHRGAC
jgi:hypothetical protein